MNRIYRLVWNRALNVMQVASEFARSPSGGAVASAEDRAPGLSVRPLAGALALLLGASLMVSSPAAFAMPGPGLFTVTQSTDDGSGTVEGTLSWAIVQANLIPGSTIDLALTATRLPAATGCRRSPCRPSFIAKATSPSAPR